MPIIGKVGRRSLRVRILNISIHLVLILGGITMIYPFLIMVSGSFKSEVDGRRFSIYPEFFTDNDILWQKFVESRYSEYGPQMIESYYSRFASFDQVRPPTEFERSRQRHEDFKTFLDETRDLHWLGDYMVSEQYARGVSPRNERDWRETLKTEVDGDLEVFNRKYGIGAQNWDVVRFQEVRPLSRRFNADYSSSLYQSRYAEYREELPLWQRIYATLDGNFIENELKPTYRSDLRELNEALGTDYPTWESIKLPRTYPAGEPLAKHWARFVLDTLNVHHIRLTDTGLTEFRAFLKSKYQDDIRSLNRVYSTSYADFSAVELPSPLPDSGALVADFSSFLEDVAAPEHAVLDSLPYRYRDWLENKYNRDLAALNKAHGMGYGSFTDVPLPREAPRYNLAYQNDWHAFLVKRAAPEVIGLMPSRARTDWLDFVKPLFPDAKGEFDIKKYNAFTANSFRREENIYPPASIPSVDSEPAPDLAIVTDEVESVLEGRNGFRELWLEFVREKAKPVYLTILETETGDLASQAPIFQKYLEETYGNITSLNKAYGELYPSFEKVTIDLFNSDYYFFLDNRNDIFWEFVKRNYVMVFEVMLYNGRAIINTIIYCALSILLALTINPVAAYAMSRYQLPSTYKIILVLMLTMAFPPMVMAIPSFLLLKEFNLLNTFLALVLPAAANGYFIFLLKGFFDSLPHELFECATIDGASEWSIFWNIAMALSKPIMAVIALRAFNIAYRNFMLAFIVCQDPRMWTMMVHIYQLQQRASQGVGFAALVIASIPMFVLFIFCQNIIIRGIVVPTEK
jgi:ABC-type glycerol-3-phosphate transport system permease component